MRERRAKDGGATIDGEGMDTDVEMDERARSTTCTSAAKKTPLKKGYKLCPSCNTAIPARTLICKICEHEFMTAKKKPKKNNVDPDSEKYGSAKATRHGTMDAVERFLAIQTDGDLQKLTVKMVVEGASKLAGSDLRAHKKRVKKAIDRYLAKRFPELAVGNEGLRAPCKPGFARKTGVFTRKHEVQDWLSEIKPPEIIVVLGMESKHDDGVGTFQHEKSHRKKRGRPRKSAEAVDEQEAVRRADEAEDVRRRMAEYIKSSPPPLPVPYKPPPPRPKWLPLMKFDTIARNYLEGDGATKDTLLPLADEKPGGWFIRLQPLTAADQIPRRPVQFWLKGHSSSIHQVRLPQEKSSKPQEKKQRVKPTGRAKDSSKSAKYEREQMCGHCRKTRPVHVCMSDACALKEAKGQPAKKLCEECIVDHFELSLPPEFGMWFECPKCLKVQCKKSGCNKS